MIGLKMRVVGSGKLWEEHPQIPIFIQLKHIK